MGLMKAGSVDFSNSGSVASRAEMFGCATNESFECVLFCIHKRRRVNLCMPSDAQKLPAPIIC